MNNVDTQSHSSGSPHRQVYWRGFILDGAQSEMRKNIFTNKGKALVSKLRGDGALSKEERDPCQNYLK